jgi:O-antigen/teichoic acid export membrane protein
MLKVLTAQWASTLFVGGVSFLVTIFIARNLGPQAFGMYASALAAGAMVGILLDGGMRNLVLRERTRVSPHLQTISPDLPGYALGHALCTSGVLIILAVLLFQDVNLRLALATIACFLALSLNQVTSSFKRGDGDLIADFRFQVGARAVSAVLIVLCVALGYREPWQILGIWAFAGFAYLALFKSYWQAPRWYGLTKVYRAVLPFIALDLAITIYFRSNLILLSFFDVAPDLIGQFAAAFRICEAVIMLASPIGLLIFRHYRITNDSIEGQRKHFAKLLTLAISTSIVGTAIVWVMSNQIIQWLYGPKYPNAVDMMQILALMLIFVLPNTMLTQASLALNRHRSIVFAAAVVAATSLALNTLMIPVYGIQAAAWMSVLTEALMLAITASLFFWPSHQKELSYSSSARTK